MNIKITSKDGVTLKTKGKYCTEDISVAVDESILGITPTGTYQVTDNGEYDITEYAKVNVNVASSGGGDTTQEDGLVTRTITEYTNNRVESVGKYSFYQYENLISVNLQNATIINEGAFRSCYALENINLPKVTTVGQHGFNYNNALKNVNMPNIVEIGNYAFANCKVLENVDFLTNINKIGEYALQKCLAIKNITTYAPYINKSAFSGCQSLKKVVAYNVTGLPQSFLSNCYLLEEIDLHNVTSIFNTYTFGNCYSLRKLILRRNICPTLNKSNSFDKCYHLTGTVDATYNPNGDKDCYIYVPSALVDSYKSATNWSAYADQIRALEDYTIDGTTTGELDESKI